MIITSFKNWIINNKNLSKNTADNYERSLMIFNNYLIQERILGRGVEECENITIEMIDDFILFTQQTRGVSIRTSNNYLAAIKSFLRYNRRKNKEVLDYKNLQFAKEYRNKTWFLRNHEVELFFETLRSSQWDALTKARNLAICYILIHTGLRVSELINLKHYELWEELQIIGKGKILRLVHLFKKDLELIKQYIDLKIQNGIKTDWVFVSHSNNSKWNQLSRNSVEAIIKDIAERAGIDQRVYPHIFRNTFATTLMRRWGKLMDIKTLLGHKYLSTTENYLKVTNSDLKKAQELILQNEWQF